MLLRGKEAAVDAGVLAAAGEAEDALLAKIPALALAVADRLAGTAAEEFDPEDYPAGVAVSPRFLYVWPYGVGLSQLSPAVTGSLAIIPFW